MSSTVQRKKGQSPQKNGDSHAAANGTKSAAVLNPKTEHFEFSGPYFTPVVVIGMVLTPILLNTLCNKDGCPAPWILESSSWTGDDAVKNLRKLMVPSEDSWTPRAFAAIVGWQLMHILFYLILPGEVVNGTLLRDGKSVLKYPINGFRALLVSAGLVAGSVYVYGLEPLLWIADHYLELALASIAVSLIQSLLLYVLSFRSSKVMLALGGNTGNVLYDFFIGRELNPRLWFGIDLKYLNELRPGLIGWFLLDVALAVRQGVDRAVAAGVQNVSFVDAAAHVTNSMWLVVVFQAFYVIDALWNERAILTTMDITTDGFGFMLNYGDLVWVPFTYSLQARYLTFRPQVLSQEVALGLVALKLIGLYIFRGSNGQKNDFRTNPNSPAVKHLKYMETKSGSKLLISGWWGIARHINYTGDWLMALSWCLPTGFETPIPYFYAIYFAILLWHRELRDEEKCRKKYGADWDRYCKAVPYRFVPYIY
ncbi:hypothetical protein HDU97_006965 [Phlyctochytrium planicorne]|nr:hypothetical protein HDU97_006965 [Phlyctochytrium planicorne]